MTGMILRLTFRILSQNWATDMASESIFRFTMLLWIRFRSTETTSLLIALTAVATAAGQSEKQESYSPSAIMRACL